MTRFVRPLDGSGADRREVGGKAAALDRLIGWELPVPPCAAVTTSAYCAVAREPAVRDALARLPPLSGSEADRRETDTRGDAAARDVEDALLAAPLPPGLAAELDRTAPEIAGGGRLAVRSSATTEDASVASFAGQHRSLLDVDPADVADAVRRVWASLWSPAVRRYRWAQGVDDADAAMAVVLMRMVDADVAGVLFTADPHGRPADMRVELVEGLADKLVGGQVTPEVIVVPRRGPRRVPDHLAPLVDRLARLGAAAEDRFEGPQDIEWAASGDQVFLVQSRPVTATRAPDDDGFDTPVAPDATYTSAGIAEMLPGPLPPLLWSLNGPMVDEAFRSLYDSLGVAPPDEPIVVRLRARAALDLGLLRSVATATGGSAREMEWQYFGESVTEGGEDDDEDEADDTGSRPRLVAASVRAARLRHALAREAAAVRGAIDELVGLEIPIGQLPAANLVAYRDQVHDLAARAVAAQVAVAVAAAASDRALVLFLERYASGEGTALAQRVTAGAVGAAGSGAALGLDEVAAAVDDETLGVLLGRASGRAGSGAPVESSEAVERRLEATPQGRRLVAQVRASARAAGSQAVFGSTAWEEDPSGVWRALQAHVAATAASEGRPPGEEHREALRQVERRLSSDLRWRLTRIVTGQVIDVRRRILRRLAEDAARFLALREDMKLSVLRLGGESRRTTRRAAVLLVRQGVLDDERDVELMSERELVRTLGGRAWPRRLLPARRRAYSRAERAGDLPRRFVGRPSAADERPPDEPAGPRLEGWAAGTGRHRGRPRVVQDPASARLGPDDVLVAATTDPSWTPLFLEAGAIVVEEGGPLSHAAIVARELGLPAVVNVPGATVRLADVPSVTVDGDRGLVELHHATDDGDGGQDDDQDGGQDDEVASA